ncbi:MAG: phosphoribosylglycinamide formyltransferase [Ferruginibacter sp.]
MKIAIFASGSGSNAENIICFSRKMQRFTVAAIFTNNPRAGVIEKADRLSIPCIIIDEAELDSASFLLKMNELGVNALVLAGFLKKMPRGLIQAFPTLNIHPALLPQYGGQGMYGMHVHRAVVQNKESVSGITIHEVDEWYDHGPILFQATCTVNPADTPEQLAQKIHALEYEHYPQIIEKWLASKSAS